jgi:hypothetical protein
MALSAAEQPSTRSARRDMPGPAHPGVSRSSAPKVSAFRAQGISVALIGFAPYQWAQNLLDLPAARRLIRSAQRRADLVVVTMHAGAEGGDHSHVAAGTETYLGENRGDVRRFAHAAVDAGADLVLGHGPHVLRGLEWYRQRLIAYSLGNFSSWGTLSTTGVLGTTAILRTELDFDGRFAAGRVIPMTLNGGRPVFDRAAHAITLARKLSRSDFGEHAAKLTGTGAIIPPAR